MNQVFGSDYADIYDALYAAKEYRSEAELVIRLLNKYSDGISSLLDLGCGTGNHDIFFSNAGFAVTGVDRSLPMIKSAREKLPDSHFLQGDILNLNLNKTFDAVLSLFHVLSYQVEDKEVKAFFRTLRTHMHDKSVAFVDYWNGPSVLKTQPVVTKKEFRYHDQEIVRHAIPLKLNGKPALNVKIKIEFSRDGKLTRELEENHIMRYFFNDELESFAKEAGLKIIHQETDESSWNAFMILRPIS